MMIGEIAAKVVGAAMERGFKPIDGDWEKALDYLKAHAFPLPQERVLDQNLFGVNVRGPDDIIATSSYPEAVVLAQLLNRGFAAHVARDHHEFDPHIWAVPGVWQGTPESHATALARPSEDYGAAPAFVRSDAAPPLDDADDEKWNAGVNYAITQLCSILSVDPKAISWDAATETLDGDVSAVICNAIVAAYGEEWSSKPEATARIKAALGASPAIHPRWKPGDKSDRHPQTVEEWDWRSDGAATGNDPKDRSERRLHVASDYDDPRAPDQMAIVLRIDLIRILGDYGFQRARVQTFLDDRRQVTDAAWQELVAKDDRTSPADHPDMVLITKDELWHLLIKSAPPARLVAPIDPDTGAHGSTTAYTRDQLAKLAFALFYSANLCAPQNIAAVIDEIDTCGGNCEHVSGSTCHKQEKGEHCPWSLAEDLRQLSAALYGPRDPSSYVASIFGPDQMPAFDPKPSTP